MPQGVGAVVHMGGGIYRPTTENEICDEWRAQAKEWCDDEDTTRPGEKQRNFNKRFYDGLKGRNPDLAKQFDPEVPVGIIDRATGALIHVMHVLTKAKDPRAAAVMESWTRLAARYGGVGKAISGKGMCSGLNSRIRGQFGKGMTGLHADGVLKDGTSVEIKGPGDTERPNQFSNEKKASKNGELLVIDHEACDPDGEITTDKGHCKRKKKVGDA